MEGLSRPRCKCWKQLATSTRDISHFHKTFRHSLRPEIHNQMHNWLQNSVRHILWSAAFRLYVTRRSQAWTRAQDNNDHMSFAVTQGSNRTDYRIDRIEPSNIRSSSSKLGGLRPPEPPGEAGGFPLPRISWGAPPPRTCIGYSSRSWEYFFIKFPVGARERRPPNLRYFSYLGLLRDVIGFYSNHVFSKLLLLNPHFLVF